MTSFRKNYISKGAQLETLETLDLVKVTLRVDEVLKHQHEFEGQQ